MSYIAERRLEEKERRRAEIVDAAEAAGRDVGLDALTMDDVARRARLSRALIYVYFQDRTDLMFGLAERAMQYMQLTPGMALKGLPIDVAYIGSCTNARLSDLRAAAAVIRGRKVKAGVQAICVPGSTPVKRAAEAEGLDRVFTEAGFEWHESACGFCGHIGDDRFADLRVVSTTNRNFEGRQGPKTRTHLASPATVAASAIAGCISDARRS